MDAPSTMCRWRASPATPPCACEWYSPDSRATAKWSRWASQALPFACGMPHDALMRVLLPYSRNISSVETMMAAEALRGQMTTGTLGFSQT